MRTANGIAAVLLLVPPLYSSGHDLVGIDSERERKLKALETVGAKPPPATLPGAMGAPVVRPMPRIAADVVAKGDPSRLQMEALTRMMAVNQGIVVARDLAKKPQLTVAGLAYPGTQIESVVNRAKTWDPGTTIRTCFDGGDSVSRASIRSYALEWTKYGNLVIDFGSPPTFRTCVSGDGATIRITFAQGGTASYVGKDALYFAVQHQPTMFLQGFDRADLQEHRYKSIVMHEFGHALGFEHEHQSPMSTCEGQFDFAAIEAALGWDEAKVRANFEQIKVSSLTPSGKVFTGTAPDGSTIAVSEYDKASVMHYALPKEYFQQPPGSCFIDLNASLSDLDQKAMASAYPYESAASFNARHNSDIDKLLASPRLPAVTKAALRTLKR